MSIEKEYRLKRIFKWALTHLLIFSFSMTNAQNPRLIILQDSVEIGEIFQVSLSFDHRPENDVFFPKNDNLFLPFELVNTSIFPTQTIDTISTDSLIYTLKNFEVNKSNTLSLPVWIVLGTDSSMFWSNTDTLFLKEVVPDSLINSFQLESAIPLLDQKTNSTVPLIWKLILGLLALLALITLLLQNKIRQQINWYKFLKRQSTFDVRFKSLMKSDKSPSVLTEVISLWRNHMTWIENKPYDTLSSIEIEKAANDKKVGEAIREIETSLFGEQQSERIPLALQILYNTVKERFRIRKKEFKKQLKNNYT